MPSPPLPPYKNQRATPAQLFALLFLTLAWGGSWPVVKLGVSSMPPLWFRGLGTAGGVLVLFVYACLRGISLRVPTGKRVTMLLLAIPNMVIWYSLVTVALVSVPAGRAAILGFTMPAWVALLGLCGVGERPDRLSLLGVALALLATGLLVAGAPLPPGQGLAIAALLAAAISWALGTILLRRWPIEIDTTALTLWMLLVTAIALFALSALLERGQWAMPEAAAWWAIGYNALVVLGFGNIAWFSIARRMPPVLSGLSTMMIPVVGVFSSIVMVGEQPARYDWIALILVAGALLLSVVPRPRRARLPD